MYSIDKHGQKINGVDGGVKATNYNRRGSVRQCTSIIGAPRIGEKDRMKILRFAEEQLGRALSEKQAQRLIENLEAKLMWRKEVH